MGDVGVFHPTPPISQSAPHSAENHNMTVVIPDTGLKLLNPCGMAELRYISLQ